MAEFFVEYINLKYVVSALFSGIGIIVFRFGILYFDKLTPGNLFGMKYSKA